LAKFKIVISDPEAGKSNTVELDGPKAQPLVGRQIGEVVDGSLLGLSGVKVRITGGSDIGGVPMRPNTHGGGKKYVILSGGIGFKPNKKGDRRRKLVRGTMLTDAIYQVNAVIVKEEKKTSDKAEKTKAEEA